MTDGPIRPLCSDTGRLESDINRLENDMRRKAPKNTRELNHDIISLQQRGSNQANQETR